MSNKIELLNPSSATRNPEFFQRPIIPSVRMAMAMRRKKTAAMLPKPGPDLLAVGLGNFKRGQSLPRKKMKPPFDMRWWQRFQPRFHFKQKHQPMCLALVSVFANQAGQ